MVSFRFAALLAAMLVMATFTSTSAHAHPLHGLHHRRGHLSPRHTRNLINYDHLVRRQFGYASSISKHQPRVRVVRRTTSDDHGDVSLHDNYESQLRALEAALKHYEEYGDAKSLQTYLKGFNGAGNGAAGNGADGDGVQVPAQDDEAWKKAPTKQQNSSEEEQGQQYQQQYQQQQQQQQQPQRPPPQQQPKKMKKVPKKPSSDDWTQPSNPSQSQSQPQPQPQPQPDQPSSPQPPPSSTGNSIHGYTPPSFTTHPTSPSTASLYSSTPFTGHATFYNTGLGACGIVNSDNEPIVAISRDLFEQYNPSTGNPNHNSLCGKKVEISWKGKTTQAFATDECPNCEKHSLDCSPSVFERLDNKDKGVLDGITWRFV